MKVTIATVDGVCDSYTFSPAGPGPFPAVLFYMDGPGIRPALFEMAERFAKSGYYVLLPNLHYRQGEIAPVDMASFAQNPVERERVMALVKAIDNMKVMRDTEVYLAFLDAQPNVRAGEVRCVGYCMGGGLALSAAGTFPDRVVAAASFHGGRLATDSPTSPHLVAQKAKGKLYVAVAELDHGFTAEERAKVVAALPNAIVETYPGAKHGFAVTGHPVYDREASERHWATVLKLF